MRRDVKFLLHGKEVAGYLVSKNKRTVWVLPELYNTPKLRRIGKHKVKIAPTGIDFGPGADPKALPKWYFQYQKFLERRSA